MSLKELSYYCDSYIWSVNPAAVFWHGGKIININKIFDFIKNRNDRKP